MDYGYLGFIIHKIHILWLFNGFGSTNSKAHGFRMDLDSPKSRISHKKHGSYGFFMDLKLIFVIHMDLDWIWIHGPVEIGL